MKERVAFSIFGFDIYWYGVMIAAGILLAATLMLSREKRLGLKKDLSIDLLLVTLPVALICARLYYVAFSWSQYRGNVMAILDIRSGGLAIYGGVIGGFFTVLAFARVKKLRFGVLADLAAPSLALGQAIGRWGNFANSEAYGEAAAHAWQQFFPFSVYIEADGLWHYATFFYESIWCFLIVAVLLLGERKQVFRRKGDIFWWYLALYGAERAFVEGLRTDSLFFMRARVSQLLSAALLAVAIGVFTVRAVRAGRKAGYYALICMACAIIAPWFGTGWIAAALLAIGLSGAVWAYRHTEAQAV